MSQAKKGPGPSQIDKSKNHPGDKAARPRNASAKSAAAKPVIDRAAIQARLEEVADSVARPAGIEVVEVEWKGAGKSQFVCIYIDRPEGVTLADCELVSRGFSDIMDADDPIPGTYELEVSSPGVERKLNKWADWVRFSGQKVKAVLREPVDGLTSLDGSFTATEVEDARNITVSLPGGKQVTFRFDQVLRANLKFEW